MNSVTVKTPSECTKKELRLFYENVIEARQVTPRGLEGRIKNAELLAFHFNKDDLVGVAALKLPNHSYKKNVFKKAGVENDHLRYRSEIGWVFTKSAFQKKGIASGLVLGLLNKRSPGCIFATTKTSNIGMQRILRKNGFKELGRPYRAQSNKYDLQLFVNDVDSAAC